MPRSSGIRWPGDTPRKLLGSLALFLLAFVLILSETRGRDGLPLVPGERFREAVREARRARESMRGAVQTQADTLARGECLAASLADHGLDPAVIDALLTEMESLTDVKRLHPREVYRLVRNRVGEVLRLEYDRDPRTMLVVERGPCGGAYEGRVHEVPLDRFVRKIEGSVRGSLWESMHAAGAPPALIGEFAERFAYDLDFFSDCHPGDRFVLLVEEERKQGSLIGPGRILSARYATGDRTHEATWFGGRSAGDWYDADGRPLRRAFLRSPLNYRRISSQFSRSRLHPVLGIRRPHLGVDYAAAHGTPVVTIGAGRVLYAGWRGGFGRFVQVKHANGFVTMYAHLSRYGSGIRTGARVSQGQVIGYVGSSGLATGPHLDFRVQKNGAFVNPLGLESPRVEPLTAAGLVSYRTHRNGLARMIGEMKSGNLVALDAFRHRLAGAGSLASAAEPGDEPGPRAGAPRSGMEREIP